MNMCNCGDLIKVTLNDFTGLPQRIIVGLVLKVTPGFDVDLVPKSQWSRSPKEIKLITTSGNIWCSWVDDRDEIEIIANYAA